VGKFIYLDKRRYDFPDERLTDLGYTLFSRMENREFQMFALALNDFHKTTGRTLRQHKTAHKEHLEWLNQRVKELKASGRKVVVFTHHYPTRDERVVEERHERSPYQGGFSTDSSREKCWKSRAVKLWTFGHTH
jgi:hypothetical protein